MHALAYSYRNLLQMEMHSLYHCSYVLSEFFDLTTTKTLTWECEKRYRSLFPVFFSVKQNMVDVCITQQIAWQLNSTFIRHCYLLACFITGYLIYFHLASGIHIYFPDNWKQTTNLLIEWRELKKMRFQ